MEYNIEENDSNNYWSMTEGVFNCLIDKKRTLAFSQAIKNSISKGDVVVDMGTGTGILAIVAAKAGASKVYAVEIDPKNIMTLKETFKLNGLENTIEIIEGDVTKVKLPEKVDVIIGEMIATGLIEELQIPAMNNILLYAKENVKVVLNKFESSIDLVNNNNIFYGNKFNIVRYEYPDESSLESIPYSDKIVYSFTDFSIINNSNNIDKNLELEIIDNGVINGIRISDTSYFYDKTTFNSSFAYSYPIILPIEEYTVSKGDKFLVHISYELCKGFNNLKYSITKK